MSSLFPRNLDSQQEFYDFASPIENPTMEGLGGVVSEIVATKSFERLKSVSFLGSIDYSLAPFPNGRIGNRRYTRYQHSLGVARLTSFAAKKLELNHADSKICILAGLLHDVGHAPFSHSLEPVFKKHFGFDHHEASLKMIIGKVEGHTDIYDVLKAHNVNIERLTETVCFGGKIKESDPNNPINIDTIEGIYRSHSFGRRSLPLHNPTTILLSSLLRTSTDDVKRVDDFWSYKHFYYRNLIQSPIGLISDALCRNAMERNILYFRPADFFASERTILKKMPGLLSLLRRMDPKILEEKLGPKISYIQRSFQIDQAASFSGRQDVARYLKGKVDAEVSISQAKLNSQTYDFGEQNENWVH